MLYRAGSSSVTRWLEYFSLFGYLPTTVQICPKFIKVCQTLNIPSKACQRFLKLCASGKLRQIWSHWWFHEQRRRQQRRIHLHSLHIVSPFLPPPFNGNIFYEFQTILYFNQNFPTGMEEKRPWLTFCLPNRWVSRPSFTQMPKHMNNGSLLSLSTSIRGLILVGQSR